MPRNYCELEFRIEWRDQGRYYLSARFMDPERDEENELLEPSEITIDLAELRTYEVDVARYGKRLADMVFGDPDSRIRHAFDKARRAAGPPREGLRVRMTIQTSAPELHSLRWETLRDPFYGTPLLMQDNILFSRFLSAQAFQVRPLGEATEMKALVVISNPVDLESQWGLAPVDKAGELSRARSALSTGAAGGVSITPRALETPASIYNIVADLRDHYSDILYLVCHGTLTPEDGPRLILEKEDRTAQCVKGKELVERLHDMNQRPRLVVLASCESAGDDRSNVLTAIGPKLAMAGVPSVIAMQGKISVGSVEKFMPQLFRELCRDGQIDRAVTAARNAIRDRSDWWMPVLFMRLKSGRLWPASPSDPSAFDQWDAVVTLIEDRLCVPVLGPGLVESVFGSTRDIARRWAERYEFPLAPHSRDDLSQVAQYLSYRKGKYFAISELRKHLVAHIRSKFREELVEIGSAVGQDLLECPVRPGLVDELMSHIGKNQMDRGKNEVHRLIARLPFTVLINANRDNLLREALRQEGKEPQVCLCTWITVNDQPKPYGPTLPAGYVPSIDRPLVFQVFGNMEYRESLVLTEDDYFDFLIAVTRNDSLKKASIPDVVSGALASSGLLLLGFQADDWDFRALFRGILRQPGSRLGAMYTRVAVQMSPIEGRIIDPDRASQYLKSYFQKEEITTFWGAAEDFMKRIVELCAERGIIDRQS
jgi:hypothetical protein